MMILVFVFKCNNTRTRTHSRIIIFEFEYQDLNVNIKSNKKYLILLRPYLELDTTSSLWITLAKPCIGFKTGISFIMILLTQFSAYLIFLKSFVEKLLYNC